jgi:hypothetical protein
MTHEIVCNIKIPNFTKRGNQYVTSLHISSFTCFILPALAFCWRPHFHFVVALAFSCLSQETWGWLHEHCKWSIKDTPGWQQIIWLPTVHHRWNLVSKYIRIMTTIVNRKHFLSLQISGPRKPIIIINYSKIARAVRLKNHLGISLSISQHIDFN